MTVETILIIAVETILIIVSQNLCMMISQRFLILKSLRQFSMMMHFEIVLPISFEGGNNSDISVENIFIEQRRAHVRG